MSDAVASAPTPGHELLLGLAGWVDDDLLAIARELVAVGEEAGALELLVATLSAGRRVLPQPVRDRLADAARRRIGDDLARLLPPGAPLPDRTPHVFSSDAGEPGVAERIREVVAGLTAVARSGARTSVTWRLTPAGAAPGPVPHPVVLMVLAGPAPAEVITYQVGAALARAGIAASVEAFVGGAALPPYQRAALAAAGSPVQTPPSPMPVVDRGELPRTADASSSRPDAAVPVDDGSPHGTAAPAARGAAAGGEDLPGDDGRPPSPAPVAPSDGDDATPAGGHARAARTDGIDPMESSAAGDRGAGTDDAAGRALVDGDAPGESTTRRDPAEGDVPRPAGDRAGPTVADHAVGGEAAGDGARTPVGDPARGAPTDGAGPGTPTGDTGRAAPTGDGPSGPHTGDAGPGTPTGDDPSDPRTGGAAMPVTADDGPLATPPGDTSGPGVAETVGPVAPPGRSWPDALQSRAATGRVGRPSHGPGPAPRPDRLPSSPPPPDPQPSDRQTATPQPPSPQPADQLPADRQPSSPQPSSPRPSDRQPSDPQPSGPQPSGPQPSDEGESAPQGSERGLPGAAGIDPARFDPARNAVDRTVHGGSAVLGRPESGRASGPPPNGRGGPDADVRPDPDPPGANGHPSPRPAPRPAPRTTAPATDGPPVNGHGTGAARSTSDGAPAGEREWERQWGSGSWSVPATATPDPDPEPATAPTPTTPPLSRATPSPARRSTADERAPDAGPGGASSTDAPRRHRLDGPASEAPADTGADVLDSRLTPNEQELLMRLQAELAARESGSGESPSTPRNGTSHPPARD